MKACATKDFVRCPMLYWDCGKEKWICTQSFKIIEVQDMPVSENCTLTIIQYSLGNKPESIVFKPEEK